MANGLPEQFERGQRRRLHRDLEQIRAVLAEILDGRNIQTGPGIYKRVHNGKVILSSAKGQRGASGAAGSRRWIFGDVTITGDVYPTAADIKASLEAAYSSTTPLAGDKVGLLNAGRLVFTYEILADAPDAAGTDGFYILEITVSGNDYGAVGGPPAFA